MATTPDHPTADCKRNPEAIVAAVLGLVHPQAAHVIEEARGALTEVLTKKLERHPETPSVPLQLISLNATDGIGIQIVRLMAFHRNAQHPEIGIVARGMVENPQALRVVGIQSDLRSRLTILSKPGLYIALGPEASPPAWAFHRQGETPKREMKNDQQFIVEVGSNTPSHYAREQTTDPSLFQEGAFFREYLFSIAEPSGGNDA